jgi:hypothetical protein
MEEEQSAVGKAEDTMMAERKYLLYPSFLLYTPDKKEEEHHNNDSVAH